MRRALQREPEDLIQPDGPHQADELRHIDAPRRVAKWTPTIERARTILSKYDMTISDGLDGYPSNFLAGLPPAARGMPCCWRCRPSPRDAWPGARAADRDGRPTAVAWMRLGNQDAR